MLEHLDLKGSSVRDSYRESLVEGGKVMAGAGASSSALAPLSHRDPKAYQGYEMPTFWKYRSGFS